LDEESPLTPHRLFALLILFSIAFTIIIWLAVPLIQPWYDMLQPDQGAAWYYWKLPTRNDFGMMLTWSTYLVHQLLIWGAIYWASKNLTEYKSQPSKHLTKYNYFVLAVTVVFMFIHLLRTLFPRTKPRRGCSIINMRTSIMITEP
jgi:hypothetical protein